MSKAKNKFMDVLEDISGSDLSDSESNSPAEKGAGEDHGPEAKKAKKEVTLEDLQRAGFKGGPSVLHMRPPEEQAQCNWAWSDGRAAKDGETEETAADRRATHAAATAGVEETAAYAQRALHHAEQVRSERRAEKEQQAAEKRLSFNQKEKRKRDEGQQSRGKNFVEEEKRMMRNLGVYSGFD